MRALTAILGCVRRLCWDPRHRSSDARSRSKSKRLDVSIRKAIGTFPNFEPTPRLDGVRVVAVDDERDSLNLLRTILEAAGASVRTVGNGPDALDAIRAEPGDVLIADIGMPGMDGLQLIRALRQMDEPARSMPAAALTAYARSHDRMTSLASGFQMHLVKPIDPLELIVAVATLAPRRPGAS